MRALCVLLLLTACTGQVRVKMLRDLQRAPSPFVRVFNGPESVDQPYKEVARLEVENPNGSYTEMVAQLRTEARKLGADGLLLSEFTSTEGHFDSLAGVAIVLLGKAEASSAKTLARTPCAASEELCRYEKACKKGDTPSCVGLGDALMRGDQIARDALKAADLFEEACVKGYTLACTYYGYALHQGAGRPQNDSVAILVFKRGCDQGEVSSCRYLGIVYLNSPNVEAVSGIAGLFLSKACALSDSWSCWRLGKMLDFAEFVPQNAKEAADYYRRACDLGLEYACYLQPNAQVEQAALPSLVAPR
ncbi:MAG: sel1 repeat family protein [Deltaproteobacteria bacterium]|nr:sel1 repeat family protein [Deltaproteobacteria bacterium]